jgi:hypothetical protein
MSRRAKKVQTPATETLVKLDLGCGKNKKEGFTGVDAISFDGVDIVADLRKKWRWADNSVDEVHCSHFIEHLTNDERVHFYNELYRILKKDSKATLVAPHWSSGRAYGDPTHQWPPVVEFSFYYLDKGWREVNAPHCGLKCDFNASWGYSMHPTWQSKNSETQMFGITHYREVAQDIICTVVKR